MDTAITGHTIEGGAQAPPSPFLSPAAFGLANELIAGGDRVERLTLARWHHDASRLRRGPFVAVRANRPEWPTALILEITRSAAGHDTLLRRAEGGTLFVDEIELMDADTQRMFFEFLRRARAEGPHDGGWAGRIAAGTALDPEALVAGGRFHAPLLDALDKIRTTPGRSLLRGAR